jgi:signal transduction histidine kinase
MGEEELRERLAKTEAELAKQRELIDRMLAAGAATAEFYLTDLSQARTPNEVGQGLLGITRRYVQGVIAEGATVRAGIFVADNPFDLRFGTVCGELPRKTMEAVWAAGRPEFALRHAGGADDEPLLTIAIPNPRELDQPIGVMAIDTGGVEMTDLAAAEPIIQSLVLSSSLHLDRIAAADAARFEADVAHLAARIQLMLMNPIELCAAMRVAIEQLNECDAVTAAAAVDLTGEVPELAGSFGPIDLDTAIRARDDREFADFERMRTVSIVLDGDVEGLLSVRFEDGAPIADDETLGSIVAAIVGSASRYRASTTIDLLRRTTTRQLVEAQERDRAIVAADIHDGTLQQLGASAMRLELIRARAAAGDTETMNELIDRCAADIRSCTRDLRNLLMELRPQVLDDNGLTAALAELARTVEETEVSVAVDAPDDIEDDVAITVFRIVQEALNNVRKHAHAKRAWIDVSQIDGSLRVEIRDDGVGFEGAESGPSSTGQHFGLLGMRERARMMGGEFSIVGHSGGGTTVTARLPLGGNDNQAPMIAA